VLTPAEAERLFASLRRLRDAGRAIVFISHKLAEVEAIADRVSVLRRGRLVASRAARGISARELGRLMLGDDADAAALPVRRAGRLRAGPPALEIRALCAAGPDEASTLREVDLAVQAGEVLGVVGIDGNGQRELEEVLAGARRPLRGEIRVRGEPAPASPRALRRAGVAHLSGDRESAGLVPGMSLAENFALKGSYDDRRFFRHGRFDRAAARRATDDAVRRFGISPADPDFDCAALSGGNAQKLAVARELDREPSLLIAANPTRGLDAGAARFVQAQILARAEAGAAVLLVTSDLDEALAVCDRLVALVRGRALAVPTGSDRAAIGAILVGGSSG
jgi:simple sugar transport system ATP-binding protein